MPCLLVEVETDEAQERDRVDDEVVEVEPYVVISELLSYHENNMQSMYEQLPIALRLLGNV